MKKSILIDVDDVICPNVYYETLKEIVGSNKPLEECTEYHAEDNLDTTPQQLEQYWKSVTTKSPYKDAVLATDCYEVLKALNEKYEIYICSACILEIKPEKTGNIFKFKYDFLIKTFPFLNPYNFIFTGAKHLIKADYIIDDNINKVISSIAKNKLLFTAYHNKNLTDKELKKHGIKRVNSWKEIQDILL